MNYKMLLVLIIFLGNIRVYADECNDVVDKYYKYSYDEDIDKYMSLMDLDYIDKYLGGIEAYRNYVSGAFEVYDIKDYEYDVEKCVINGKYRIAFVDLKSTVISDGKEYDIDYDYVFVLNNESGKWKIMLVMDADKFNFFMERSMEIEVMNETYEGVGKKADEISEILNVLDDKDVMVKDKKFSGWLIIILFIVLFVGVGYYYRKRVYVFWKKARGFVKDKYFVIGKRVRKIKESKEFKENVRKVKKIFKELYVRMKRVVGSILRELRRRFGRTSE